MPSWPTKDPEAVADYLYTIPLDDGDSVASYTLERLSGTVEIDSESRDGAEVTAWLSGGEDGETSVFRVSWTTAGGRTFDDIVTLAVEANEPATASGYDTPTAAQLIERYPAFADVATATIRLWIEDAAGRVVDESWPEASYGPAIMAHAAHMMVETGALTSGGAIPAGVSSFKSGTFSATVSDKVASLTGLSATSYGRQFIAMRASAFGGPRLAWEPPARVC